MTSPWLLKKRVIQWTGRLESEAIGHYSGLLALIEDPCGRSQVRLYTILQPLPKYCVLDGVLSSGFLGCLGATATGLMAYEEAMLGEIKNPR